MSEQRGQLRSWWPWVVGYVVLMGALVGGMTRLRDAALASETPDAIAARQEEWKEWRDASVRHEKGEGPVRRRARTSSEPPTVIWLRDYFPRAVAMVATATSALYVVFVLLLRGAMLHSAEPPTASK